MTVAALKYHLYKPGGSKASTAILPVRVIGAERPVVEIDVGPRRAAAGPRTHREG